MENNYALIIFFLWFARRVASLLSLWLLYRFHGFTHFLAPTSPRWTVVWILITALLLYRWQKNEPGPVRNRASLIQLRSWMKDKATMMSQSSQAITSIKSPPVEYYDCKSVGIDTDKLWLPLQTATLVWRQLSMRQLSCATLAAAS